MVFIDVQNFLSFRTVMKKLRFRKPEKNYPNKKVKYQMYVSRPSIVYLAWCLVE